MQNLSNFLLSQKLTKPSLFSSEYQIRVPDQIWPKKVHFYVAKETFFKYPENTEKWPFCLSPDVQNFSNFLMSQILTKPSLFSSAFQVRVNNQIWAKKVHFYITLKTFYKYSENTEKWPFCLSPDMQNFSNFLMSQILTKPSLFSSEYQIRVPDQIWPKKVHFYMF